MEITVEVVRQFFTKKKLWGIPVVLILFVLCVLVLVTDHAPAMAPFALRAH